MEDWTDEESGHSAVAGLPQVCAYKVATELKTKPAVILAKTIKGWTLGPDVEGATPPTRSRK